MHVEGDLHVVLNHHAGHDPSSDCWCEPNKIYLATVRGLPGVTRVIEHNDECNEHHLVTVNKRERDRALPYMKNEPDASWITRVLALAGQPRPFPPHNPDERNP